jgi:drug/metabolite transporter (DMT)-like permease
MIIALSVGSFIYTLFGFSGLKLRAHWKVYFIASLGLFPNMALVYCSTEYISSGLVALMFGMIPFFTAILSKPISGESTLLPRKLIAIIIAVTGLFCIFIDDAIIEGDAYIGLLLMMLSNLIFSACVLYLKKINAVLMVPPFEQTLGAMAFSLPGMLITWLLFIGYEPLEFSAVSLGSLLYLSLFGSLVGFAAYYHILNNISVENVALIPLITPVVAMALGVLVAGESITTSMYIGALLIFIALIIHQDILLIFYRWRLNRHKKISKKNKTQ